MVKVKELVFDSIEKCREKGIDESEAWEKAGRPILWCTVEKEYDYGEFVAQVDIGYGAVRLIKDGKEIARGKHAAISGNNARVIVLDKEYFGLEKYIWR
jgi:hypothetical protein